MTSATSGVARAFGLTSTEAWMRHANPWSVYTRIPIPAMLCAAIWTYDWIGWWSLALVAVVVVWAVINPRVFPPPRTLDAWASKSVLGETYWSNRKNVPIPDRHRVAPIVLTGFNTAGLVFIVWGLIVLNLWIVLFGLAVHMAGKNWFLDRMAILYDDMKALEAARGHQVDAHGPQPA
ncbi:MAG TPA: DUF6653 family protein [Actinoplanes sp.]|nr:DUF6653 family protein [Actinoplanes sp.]